MLMLLGVAVFAATFVYDVVNVRFLVAVTQGKPNRASLWSGSTALLSLAGVAGVLQYSYWLVIPYVLGFAAGANVGVRSVVTRPDKKIEVVIVELDEAAEASEQAHAN